MANKKSVFGLPVNSWLWLLISLAIPLIGIFILKWNLIGLLFLFWLEIILAGIFGGLRILCALAGAPKFYYGLLPRLFQLAFFVILYGGLAMLIISYSLVNFDTDQAFSDDSANKGFGLAMIAMTIRFTMEFTKDYLMSGRFRESTTVGEIMNAFIYGIPLAMVVLFLLSPYAEKNPGRVGNLIIILGIILAKTLIEYIIYYFKEQQFIKQAFNVEEAPAQQEEE